MLLFMFAIFIKTVPTVLRRHKFAVSLCIHKVDAAIAGSIYYIEREPRHFAIFLNEMICFKIVLPCHITMKLAQLFIIFIFSFL